MTTKLYAYNPHSEGARELTTALGIKRIKHEGSLFRGRANDTVINWGSSQTHPSFGLAHILNKPADCARAGDKLAFFRHLGEHSVQPVRVPEWTDSSHVARSWVDSGLLVVARTILRGHSGAGIKILEPGVDFVQAPLYTKYVKKDKEYRVHCFKDDLLAPILTASQPSYHVIDLQRKARDPAFVGEPNWRVRNHHNGFIYVRNDVQAPQDVTRQALQAFEASGLDFGAVDVIWNEHQQRAYVLEINTAPGLVGTTVQKYESAFKSSIAGL